MKSKTFKKQQGANMMQSHIIFRQRFIHRAGVGPQNIQRQIYLLQSNELSNIFGFKPTDEKYNDHFISSSGSLAV